MRLGFNMALGRVENAVEDAVYNGKALQSCKLIAGKSSITVLL